MHRLIVGGTHGIGRALLRLWAENGDTVSVIGRRTPPEIDRYPDQVQLFTVDLAQTEALREVLAQVLARAPLSGVVFFQRFRGKSDTWEGELAVSLSATRTIIETVAPQMPAARETAITLVTSIATHMVAQEQPVSYHVAKAGLLQMMRYYAVTLGKAQIRVNCVSPGIVLKEEAQAFFEKNPALQALYTQITPLGRMGTSEEIAETINFLHTPAASFVTGQNLLVDGGVSLQWQETLARELLHGDLNIVRQPTEKDSR